MAFEEFKVAGLKRLLSHLKVTDFDLIFLGKVMTLESDVVSVELGHDNSSYPFDIFVTPNLEMSDSAFRKFLQSHGITNFNPVIGRGNRCAAYSVLIGERKYIIYNETID